MDLDSSQSSINMEEVSTEGNNILSDLRPGSIVWARLSKTGRFYIGLILPRLPQFATNSRKQKVLFWFAEKEISQVNVNQITHFLNTDYKNNTFSERGFVEAVKMIMSQYNLENQEAQPKSTRQLDQWIKDKSKFKHCDYCIPSYILKRVQEIANELASDESRSSCSQTELESKYKKIFDTAYSSRSTKTVCLGCKEEEVKERGIHPLFDGYLCIYCYDRVINNITSCSLLNDDERYCCVCGWLMDFISCSSCSRDFCTDCVYFWLEKQTRQLYITEKLKWTCLVCIKEDEKLSPKLKVREDYEEKLHKLTDEYDSIQEIEKPLRPPCKQNIRVLSLFDGISTGLLALLKLGFRVSKYYASEIDEHSIVVSKYNHGDLVQHLGDIKSISEGTLKDILPIHLVIGGSPCNDLSQVNPIRKGLTDMSGSGALFFEFYRVMTLLERLQGTPKTFFFLFENVSSMEISHKNTISRFLEVKPVCIDAKNYSAMRRPRLFWTNTPNKRRFVASDFQQNSSQENMTLQEHLTPNLRRVAVVDKIRTVTTNRNSLTKYDGSSQVIMDGQESSLTVTELEKLFGLPEHYTDVLDLSPRQRQSLLGKSWSVPVIQNILEPLKEFFFMEWEEYLNEDEPSSSNHHNRQQHKDEDEPIPMICHKRRKHVDEPDKTLSLVGDSNISCASHENKPVEDQPQDLKEEDGSSLSSYPTTHMTLRNGFLGW